MKHFFFISLFLFSFWPSQGQNKMVESARVAFISQRTNLTPAQAEKFWPVYNEFSNQKSDIRKNIRGIYRELNTKPEQTSESLKQYLVQYNQLKQQELNLEKEYQQRYLLIITPRQLVDLMVAEHEFHKILIKKMSED
jgi:Spy/CpxP family protein refolding chaperone